MLKLDAKSASSADNVSTSIRDAGKYIGEFTRAEKLLSQNGTQGLGLSFKSDDGQTADYLDLYTINAAGDELPSAKTVNAILACMSVREADEAAIKFEKWDKSANARVQVEANGYPALMKKKIGLLLQKEVYFDQKGEERERVIIYGVFNASSELTASEILAKKTTPEKLPKILEALMARPVKDARKGKAVVKTGSLSASDDTDPDIPF